MKNWLEAIPFVEFAYNRTPHSATKFSPFQIVYGFNPTTPLDLTPLPPAEFVNVDGEAKAAYVKKLHQKVKENLEKQNATRAKQANKGRKKMVFQPGDWVWLHYRTERFPNKRNSKLAPRGDGPFKVLEKINDNAYRLELPGEYTVSPSFNVTDLAPFNADDPVLRSKPSQGGGNDEDIQPLGEPPREVLDPFVPNRPFTRSRNKGTQHQVNLFVGKLLEQLEHMDKAQDSLTKDLATRPSQVELTGDQELKLHQTKEDNPANHLDPQEDFQESLDHLETSLKALKITEFQSFQFGPGLADKPTLATTQCQTGLDHDPGATNQTKMLVKAKAAIDIKENGPIQAQEDPWPFFTQKSKFGYNLLSTSFNE